MVERVTETETGTERLQKCDINLICQLDIAMPIIEFVDSISGDAHISNTLQNAK